MTITATYVPNVRYMQEKDRSIVDLRIGDQQRIWQFPAHPDYDAEALASLVAREHGVKAKPANLIADVFFTETVDDAASWYHNLYEALEARDDAIAEELNAELEKINRSATYGLQKEID